MATWSIANLERQADGGVIVAHWRCNDSETVGSGDDAVTYTASSYGTCSFTPDADADDFVAYDDLTEATVIGWVKAEVDGDAVETSLTDNISSQKTPTTFDGVPWND